MRTSEAKIRLERRCMFRVVGFQMRLGLVEKQCRVPLISSGRKPCCTWAAVMLEWLEVLQFGALSEMACLCVEEVLARVAARSRVTEIFSLSSSMPAWWEGKL